MLRLMTLLAGMVVVGAALCGQAQAQVPLATRYNENTTTIIELTQKTHQVLTLNGMDLTTDNQGVFTTRSENGSRDADGRLPVKSTIVSIFSNMSLPGGLELTFDSNSPADSPNPDLQPIVDILRALSGSSYTTVLDEKNRAVDVQGAEKVLESVPESVRSLLAGELDPEYLKQVHNQELDRLPGDPVQVGDAWLRNETYRLGAGQEFTFQTRYEYAGNVEKEGKSLDKIAMTTTGVTYRMDAGPNAPAKVTRSDLAVESSTGTLLFDRQRGTVVDARNLIHIKGDMTLEAGGQEYPATLDLTMEQTTVVKPSSP